MICQSSVTALLREAASFVPGYECNSPVATSGFDRLIFGIPPYIGIPPYRETPAVPPSTDPGP